MPDQHSLASQDAETLQRALYNRIHTDYERHYGDPWSDRYRREFMYDRLFADVPLKNARVLEAMSGSGQTTECLMQRGASVTGLDISSAAIDSFRRRYPNCEAICASVLDSGLPAESFDCVVVSGGLHHLHPHVTEAVTELHRVLRPGGYFCFVEPHAGSFADVARRYWYRRDPLFAPNEAAVDVQLLRRSFAGKFEFLNECYLGNIAYLLIYNSLIFRIPLPLKRWIAPPLLAIERLIRPLQTQLTSCFVTARWRKTYSKSANQAA